jgi:hypothetical protein
MSVEMISHSSEGRQDAGPRPDRVLRPVAGVLDDGTAFYAPIGEVVLDARWLPALSRFGFTDVVGYLCERHLGQHQTVNAIATETGFSHHAIRAALGRHGLAHVSHTAKRHAISQREDQVAAALADDRTAFRQCAEKLGPALAEHGEPVRSAFTVSLSRGAIREIGEPVRVGSGREGTSA